MMRVIVILMIILLCSFVPAYAEDSELYNEVYYSKTKEQDNYFDKLDEAIQKVKDGGTVYLKNNVKFLDKTLTIDKSVKIKSWNNQVYAIELTKAMTVFQLTNNPSWFTLEGVEITGSNVNVINGYANQITIKDSIFNSSIPFYITSNGNYLINLESNKFQNTNMSFKPTLGDNRIHFKNNTFTLNPGSTNTITFKNIHIYAENNHFGDYSLSLEDGEEIEAQISNNTFTGDRGSIIIKNKGIGVHFNYNIIIKNNGAAIQYNGSENPDFTRNWWGSQEGPGSHIPKDKIDCSSWALFEDFSRFHGQPYTIEDLKAACSLWNQEVEGKNWIYDLQEDEFIDILDIIGIIRQIE